MNKDNQDILAIVIFIIISMTFYWVGKHDSKKYLCQTTNQEKSYQEVKQIYENL